MWNQAQFRPLVAKMDQRTRTSVLNVARLLDRAEEARSQAQNMRLPHTRLQMLKLAETYQHMADIALEYTKYRREADDAAFQDRPTEAIVLRPMLVRPTPKAAVRPKPL